MFEYFSLNKFYIIVIITSYVFQVWAYIPEVALLTLTAAFILFVCFIAIAIKSIHFTTTIFTLLASTMVEIFISTKSIFQTIPQEIIYSPYSSTQEFLQLILSYVIYTVSQIYSICRQMFKITMKSPLLNAQFVDVDCTVALYEVNYILNTIFDMCKTGCYNFIAACYELLYSVILSVYVFFIAVLYTVFGPIDKILDPHGMIEGYSHLAQSLNNAIGHLIDIDKITRSTEFNNEFKFGFLIKSFNDTMSPGSDAFNSASLRIENFIN